MVMHEGDKVDISRGATFSDASRVAIRAIAKAITPEAALIRRCLRAGWKEATGHLKAVKVSGGAAAGPDRSLSEARGIPVSTSGESTRSTRHDGH